MSVLAVEQLRVRAAERTGLSDYGEDPYVEGLNLLVAAYNENPYFTGAGLQSAGEQIVGILTSRLESEAGWQRDDRWRTTTINEPLFIVGIARSGTTALHRLIAQDPDMQSMPYWLGVHPQPRPPADTWPSLAGFRAVKARLDAMYERSPQLRAVHEMWPDEADECRLLRVQSFTDFVLATSYVPAYRQWLISADLGPTYARYARNLRLIASGDERRWVLKCPGHLWGLDALLTEFPDARVVWTHRAPEEAIASTCSAYYPAAQNAEPTLPLDVFSGFHVERWRLAIDRAERSRAGRPSRQFYDVDYERFVADPLGEVNRIYDHFGIGLSDRARQAMTMWNEHRPHGYHGQHRYLAADFALDEQAIRDAFAPYRARHQLP
jgi:hypothetical protein